MSRVLVLGAGGMLGHKLCQMLPPMGFEVGATVRKSVEFYAPHARLFSGVELIGGVDAFDFDGMEAVIAAWEPEAVINCIGIIKQIQEARNPLISIEINSLLPHRLAAFCGRIGSRFVQISTDCVFSGEKGSYIESDQSDARDLYGRTKFLGETTDEESAAITLRTSIVGREISESKHGLLEWFFRQTQTPDNTISGFSKAIYTGFTTIELAGIMAMVIREHPELTGVYHVAGEPINKFDLLCMVRDVMGLDIRIEPDAGFVCDRSLVMNRFTAATGYAAPSWRDTIEEFSGDCEKYGS
ncbi:MAG: SDR family oxidoreductase [Phycisphaerae bacterium]|nr:SDR family oxidoreductase [Phycisphaerae bacterium]